MKRVTSFIFALLFFNAFAQQDTPFLERQITIIFTEERLDDALRKLGKAGGFTFSYSASLIDPSRKISVAFSNKTVREILDNLFQGTLEYKERSRHIILTKAKTASNTGASTLSGYVIDEATGKRLKNVSVYDPVTLSSAITDSYGYFEIKFSKPPTDVRLSVNKENYADTVVAVPTANRKLINIPIHVDKRKLMVMIDSVGSKIKKFWKTEVLYPKNPNLTNIQDTLHRMFQVSVIPFIGTNHKLSGNVVNEISFNMLGGYAMGTNAFELGGLFNIERGFVTGGQFAGLFNIVGGKMNGFQVAGLFNANYDTVQAAQLAGLMNINWHAASEFSAAGLMNFNRRHSRGVHLAGLGNFTQGRQKGVHIAGLFNFASADSGPLQLSSILNFTSANFRGVQAGALLNFTRRDIQGAQVGSVVNFAGRRVIGTQIAGVLNFGKNVRGSQIGLINISDTISGVPLGLINIVMKGYHKFEVSADEAFYLNFAFRTGVRKFYNILSVGAAPETFPYNQTRWTFGYGIGTARKLSRWLSLNLDLTSSQVVHQRRIDHISLLNKFHLGFDIHATKNFSIALGPTLNGHLTRTTEAYPPIFADYQPTIFYNNSLSSDLALRMWVGMKAGLRFL